MTKSMPRDDRARLGAFALCALLSLGAVTAARAQAAEPPAKAAAAPTAVSAEAAAEDLFTTAELEKLLAPYALYPDALLAQVLPSCAYPIELVQLSRWLAKNKAAVGKGDFSAVDTQSWDPSVKALARFGPVVEALNTDLDATTDLGDAFVNQPDDVANVIQDLRRRAEKAGSLKTTSEQRVTTQVQGDRSYVVIEPSDPDVLYVPSYDPVTVYDPGTAIVSGLVGFGAGVVVGAAINNAWDWGRGWVYPPRWPGYPGYRPGGGNINIGNDISIGGNNNVNIGNGNNRPWRPDGDRYRPGQGSHPNIGTRPNRPGGGNSVNIGNGNNRSGGGNSVNIGNGNNRPGGGNSVNIGNGNNRPGGGNSVNIGNGNNRPGGTGNRPNAGKPSTRPAAAQRPAAPRPARDSAFGDARLGGSAKPMAQRGAVSRQTTARPMGGGGRPAFQGGGRGGGGGVSRGGGGRGGGGGMRARGRH